MTYFGLDKQCWDIMQTQFLQMTSIEEVILFGSRAMGNWKPGSDIDLAIKGTAFTHDDLLSLSCYLNEEAPIPWKLDIVVYSEINSEELLNHIETLGVTIYRACPGDTK